MRHNYRKTDPITSFLAGLDCYIAGTAIRHGHLCLRAVTATPGLTAREIEARIGIKAHKRLPELRTAGLVRNGKPRLCTITGRLAMTWYRADVPCLACAAKRLAQFTLFCGAPA